MFFEGEVTFKDRGDPPAVLSGTRLAREMQLSRVWVEHLHQMTHTASPHKARSRDRWMDAWGMRPGLADLHSGAPGES